MPRPALSRADVERFRESLCAVATRRFAEFGYAGVTLRALAAELGCSPMTPYRYFQNKDGIFEAVRSAGFGRLARAERAAAEAAHEPTRRLRALGQAYVRFALEEPHAYRIMFELDPPRAGGKPSAEEAQAWQIVRDTVGEAIRSGGLVGDPDVLAHLYWSGLHGLVALHLAGKLRLGLRLEDLVEAWMDRELGVAKTPG